MSESQIRPEQSRTHAALMDRVYRQQRHIYDLTRKYFLLGRDHLIQQLHAKPDERVVEIGCGTARNLIRMARTYPGVQFYGLDASKEMLRTAEQAVRRAGLSERIHLVHGLAEEISPALFGESELFDRAIFSYSLSMITDWSAALKTAAGVVRPEGKIHAVDFGDLAGLWRPVGRILLAWLRLFHVAPRVKLLKILESVARDQAGTDLYIMAGRYAFVLEATPSIICEIDPHSVAG